MPTDSRRVFVLMPFDERFDIAYDRLIRAPFVNVGFEVLRADDINSSASILADIVGSIADAELVIADMTDNNPNVFYELGLAHGMRKNVVLLAQDI